MKNKTLKLYYCQWADDDDSNIGVVAYNSKMAVRLARADDDMQTWFSEGNYRYIDLKCRLAKDNKDVNLTPYSMPFVANGNDNDWKEYLKNGIYGGVMMTCEKCHADEAVCYYDKKTDKCVCGDCESDDN